MSSWTYRIVRDHDGVLAMRAVGYDDEGVPDTVTADTPEAESIEELTEYYSRALSKPVLTEVGEELVEEQA